MVYATKPVPGADQFFPLNEVPVGSALPEDVYPQNKTLPKLFQPLTIKGVTFSNRVFVSPMCQYSSDNGHATDWHLVEIGGYASRGVGGICIEATSVMPGGRISTEDAGLWTDSQIAPLKRIVDFVHAQGSKVGIQLGHAGRKSSSIAPWLRHNLVTGYSPESYVLPVEAGGWPDHVYGPSDIPFTPKFAKPKPLTEEQLFEIEDAFEAAIERCKAVGFDFIELHYAHGYLMSTFLSPLSNVRNDQYGGEPLENRMRWPLRLAERCRKAWADKPLFVRISASDWAETALGPEKSSDGKWVWWGVEQSKIFVGELKKLGVDLVDVSSGGVLEEQNITVGPGYQVPFAEEIKKAHPDVLLGSVGMITSATQAESYLAEGKTDAIFIARELIRNPHWVQHAAQALGVAVKPANQYERAWRIRPAVKN